MSPAPAPSTPQDTTQVASMSCFICRSRKVGCDKRLPGCSNCERLGVPCPGFDPEQNSKPRKELEEAAEDIFKAAGLEKRKVGSCQACRASKHKCCQTMPSCRRCILRRIPCVYQTRSVSDKGGTLSSRKVARKEARGVSRETPTKPRQLAKIVPHPVYNSDVTMHSDDEMAHTPKASPGSSPLTPIYAEIDMASLYSETLPQDKYTQSRLLRLFFSRSSSLRILSFIHEISFMESFERGTAAQDYGEPLLYVMCALGARTMFYDHRAANTQPDPFGGREEIAGGKWVDRARKEILVNTHAPSIQHLMAMLLICDYGLRQEQNTLVFTMISFVYRTIRLLSLDTHQNLPPDATPTEIINRECEIRIVWACYFVDAMVGSGVAKNLCWRDDYPEIPLPCVVYAPEYIQAAPQHFMSSIQDESRAALISELDYQSISLYIISLRTRVMREARNPTPGLDPWLEGSAFRSILTKLAIIYDNLPAKYEMNEANMAAMRAEGILGGVFTLHLLMNAIVFDLTRVALPGFSFPLAEWLHQGPEDFLKRCQQLCYSHAEQVSHLIRKGMSFDRATTDDVFCADATLESAKIQLIYTATVNANPQFIPSVNANVRSSIEFIQSLPRRRETKEHILGGLLPICELFGFTALVEKCKTVIDNYDANDQSIKLENHTPNRTITTPQQSQEWIRPLNHGISRTPVKRVHGNGNDQLKSLSRFAGQGGMEEPAPKPLHLLPAAGLPAQNRSIFQPSTDDYSATAANMSELIKRGVPILTRVALPRPGELTVLREDGRTT